MIWNKEIKKVAAKFLFLLIVGMIWINLCMALYAAGVRKQYHEFLSAVVGNVAVMYPDVSEEKLIVSINKSGHEETGRTILAQYGLFGESKDTSVDAQEKLLASIWITMLSTCFIMFFSCGVLFFCYLGKRQKRILGLEDYMETINRGIYRLELEDNTDDELSGLRNEIYKLTVMRKEQADMAVGQRRALADSVTDISHQLKTPLTSVSVLVDNLAANKEMDEETRQSFLREISRQTAGMSWLITVMMKLSRLDAGVVELAYERFELKAFLEEILQRLEMAAEWKQVSFEINVPEGVMLTADRKWTGEALINLVKNAVEHSPEGGCVEVAGEENDIYTQISVRDHGTGISEEERKKLFRRFYNGRTAREDSTGIGLALAKEIVEKQDGRISVDSQAGKGSIFVIRFLKQG